MEASSDCAGRSRGAPLFPRTFPNQFAAYAGAALGGDGPFALLDHHDGERYREVLVAEPEFAIEVLEVIALPQDKQSAEVFVRERFGPPAAG